MKKVRLHIPRIVDNRYLMDETMVCANQWIKTPPYAVKQDVLVKDFDDNVYLGWIESCVVSENGNYKITGIRGSTNKGWGAKPVKSYMIIPMPFDDHTGWNMTCDEKQPKKNKEYLLAVETTHGNRRSYRLRLSYYVDGKYNDWLGFDSPNSYVIAWRDLPH